MTPLTFVNDMNLKSTDGSRGIIHFALKMNFKIREILVCGLRSMIACARKKYIYMYVCIYMYVHDISDEGLRPKRFITSLLFKLI